MAGLPQLGAQLVDSERLMNPPAARRDRDRLAHLECAEREIAQLGQRRRARDGEGRSQAPFRIRRLREAPNGWRDGAARRATQ